MHHPNSPIISVAVFRIPLNIDTKAVVLLGFGDEHTGVKKGTVKDDELLGVPSFSGKQGLVYVRHVVIGGHFMRFGEGIGFEHVLVKGFGDVGAVLEHGTDGYLALGAWIAWGV
jgi:hypothetical protein